MGCIVVGVVLRLLDSGVVSRLLLVAWAGTLPRRDFRFLRLLGWQHHATSAGCCLRSLNVVFLFSISSFDLRLLLCCFNCYFNPICCCECNFFIVCSLCLSDIRLIKSLCGFLRRRERRQSSNDMAKLIRLEQTKLTSIFFSKADPRLNALLP
jgi:hypothetical protein